MGTVSRFIVSFSGMVVLPAVVLIYYYPNIMDDILSHPTISRYSSVLKQTIGETPGDNGGLSSGEKLFTAAELAEYDGRGKDKDIYLSLLGRVFDVTRGHEHYGPDGGYRHFSGRDATRSFVTGDFTPDGLSDDVSGFTPDQLLAIDNWLKFYEKDYKYVGRLIGRYYNSQGNPTSVLQSIHQEVDHERLKEREEEAKRQQFPGCNSEWVNGKGGKIWCSKRSGGVERDWAGFPRLLFDPATGQTRCTCVHQSQLGNSNLREYKNCLSDTEACPLSEEGEN